METCLLGPQRPRCLEGGYYYLIVHHQLTKHVTPVNCTSHWIKLNGDWRHNACGQRCNLVYNHIYNSIMATAGASSVGKSQWNPKEHVEYLFTESLHQIAIPNRRCYIVNRGCQLPPKWYQQGSDIYTEDRSEPEKPRIKSAVSRFSLVLMRQGNWMPCRSYTMNHDTLAKVHVRICCVSAIPSSSSSDNYSILSCPTSVTSSCPAWSKRPRKRRGVVILTTMLRTESMFHPGHSMVTYYINNISDLSVNEVRVLPPDLSR